MLISCPNCATSYDLSAASLGAEGRQVRCVRCQGVWFASSGEAPAAAVAEEAPGTAVSAATASAQYRRGAPGVADDFLGHPPDDVVAVDREIEVDANLAARAADRSGVPHGDLPALEDDASAADVEYDSELAEHMAPPLAPDGEEPAAVTLEASPAHEPTDDIESFAARRARRETLRRMRRARRPSLATVTVALLAVNIALVGWRSDVVRLMPQTASLFAAIGLPVNLRGVAFQDVTTTIEEHDGVSVMLVQGTIANVTRQARDVPRIRVAMRNGAGSEVYAWTAMPEHPVLAAGQVERFQTRLASPPAEGRSVAVRFFTRRDFGGGAH
jgi:predicted Zn finger-like uncharacterized protein